MTHPVQVDEATIASAFDAKEAQADAAAPEAMAAAMPVANPEAWLPAARFGASFLAHKFCPAWEVPTVVQEDWAAALAECLDQLMPGGMDNIENWGPWSKLAFASATWAMCGFDMERFGFKPLQQKLPPPEAEQSAITSTSPAGSPATREPFSTVA